MSNKIIPTYYLISRKKIETLPISLQPHKDCVYYLGGTSKEKFEFVIECVDDFKNIFHLLERIGFYFCGVASIENMNESLVSEFILKETFDAIFYVKDEADSKSLSFITSLMANIDEVRSDLENSSRWLAEVDSYVESHANVEIHKNYESLVDDINATHAKTEMFKEISINYLRGNIIKYIKLH